MLTKSRSNPGSVELGSSDLSSLMFETRTIFLMGFLDTGKADDIVSKLLLLNAIDPEAAINLHINSSGGRPQAGLTVYDAMRSIRAPVVTTCIGEAKEVSGVIFAAGEQGTRALSPNSSLEITLRLDAYNLPQDVVDRLNRDFETIVGSNSLFRRGEYSDQTIGAEEAIKLGFADTILAKPAPQKPRNIAPR